MMRWAIIFLVVALVEVAGDHLEQVHGGDHAFERPELIDDQRQVKGLPAKSCSIYRLTFEPSSVFPIHI